MYDRIRSEVLCTTKLGENSPIVCAVLALDSWNYCSGEQGPTAQHMQDSPNLLYTAELLCIKQK